MGLIFQQKAKKTLNYSTCFLNFNFTAGWLDYLIGHNLVILPWGAFLTSKLNICALPNSQFFLLVFEPKSILMSDFFEQIKGVNLINRQKCSSAANKPSLYMVPLMLLILERLLSKSIQKIFAILWSFCHPSNVFHH